MSSPKSFLILSSDNMYVSAHHPLGYLLVSDEGKSKEEAVGGGNNRNRLIKHKTVVF